MSETAVQYCTFRLGELLLGIEVGRVQEVIRHQPTTRVPLAAAVVEGLINLRGQIVTALDLRRRIGLPDRPEHAEPVNIVIRSSTGTLSLLVDEIGDVVDVAESAYEDPPETLPGVARELIRGVYKLDGHLLLVLDTDRVVQIPAAA